MEHVDVKQCDRKAAANFTGVDISDGQKIRGQWENIYGSHGYANAVHSFARHRLATEADLTALLEQAREALDFIANVGRITPGFSALAVNEADKAQAAINDKLGDG